MAGLNGILPPSGETAHFQRPVLISNPESGRNRKEGLDALHRLAQAAGIPYHTPALAELHSLLQTLAGRQTDLLIVNGGDGTLDTVLTCLRRNPWAMREPAIALLGGGTTNMVHGDVGIGKGPLDGLKRIAAALRAQRNEPLVHRPLIKVTRSGDAENHYGFFLGITGLPRAILFARERFHTRGFTGPLSELSVIVAMIGRLFSGRIERDPVLSPLPVTFAHGNDALREVRCALGFVTTLKRLVLGIRPMQADTGEDLYNVLLSYPYTKFWRVLPALLRRRPLPAIPGLHLQASKTTILHLDSAWVLDGEMFGGAGEERLTITADAPVRFWRPR